MATTTDTSRRVKVQSHPMSAAPQRLYSLDALRGFDMFWIAGAEEIVHTMATATGNSFWKGFSNQLTHPAWNGFHFYDLIFPAVSFYRRRCNTLFQSGGNGRKEKAQTNFCGA
jgi:predicted acyltransferase